MNVTNKRLYRLEDYMNGVSIDEFSSLVKPNMLVGISNLKNDANFYNLVFRVRKLTDLEVFEQAVRDYQREDGQFVLNGEFTPVEEISKQIYEHSRVLLFEGNIE